MQSSDFLARLQRFRQKNPQVVGKSTSRIESLMPRLSVTRVGRYSAVAGLEMLARCTRRQPAYVIKYFTKFTACVVDRMEDQRLILRGHVAPNDVRRFQNQYLKHKILCSFCQSPDTILELDRIVCKNCDKARPDTDL